MSETARSSPSFLGQSEPYNPMLISLDSARLKAAPTFEGAAVLRPYKPDCYADSERHSRRSRAG